MELFNKFKSAISHGAHRIKVGALEAVLINELKSNNQQRQLELINEIALMAWQFPQINEFYSGFGFTPKDFVRMYMIGVISNKTKLIENKKLIITWLLIDEFEKNRILFSYLGNSISNLDQANRDESISDFINKMVKKVAE